MNESKAKLYSICKSCQNTYTNSNCESSSNDTESSVAKCAKWLENCTTSDDDRNSEASCDMCSTTSETTDTTESSLCENVIYQNGESILSMSSGVIDNLQVSSNKFNKINFFNCKRIHMGNVTKVYAPVQINQTVASITQKSTTKKIFLNGIAEVVPTKKLSIVDRRSWIAQPPVQEIELLDTPTKLVIISHTATENGLTQAENVLHVRTIQTFHIESRKWNDIGYNYLVGCDGKIYEGRGWGVVGAHTLGYNNRSIGISFIGCFLTSLPTEAALNQAKSLIQRGVEIGEIDENYTLLGHCQCCATESPGRRLFEEIQTWDHWSSTVPE